MHVAEVSSATQHMAAARPATTTHLCAILRMGCGRKRLTLRLSCAHAVPAAAATDAAHIPTAAAALRTPRQQPGLLAARRYQAGRAQGRVQEQPHREWPAAADERPP